MPENLIEKTKSWVQARLTEAESGHDWWHIQRVYKTAMHLAKSENADETTVALAALLHDLTDTKLTDRAEAIEAEIVAFLQQIGASASLIEQVMYIVRNMSFRHSAHFTGNKTIEFQVVQDADRLDAIGAIGIARAFSYGGFKKRPFLNFETRAEAEAFFGNSNTDASTIGHFYEKLLLLKDMMNTKSARRLAEERHIFMLRWLDEFYREWEGEI
ncbi:MAG: HD domain-containing protein [Bacteroidia bacterium]|jgi:uncharacterized protein|nr:HD domain-containing protein [Bacteroidia bacterium]